MNKPSKWHNPQTQKDWGGNSTASIMKVEQRTPKPLPGQTAQQQHDGQMLWGLKGMRGDKRV